jgi:hypothetical protein
VNTIRVKIIKATKGTEWYSNHIGDVFEVYDRICGVTGCYEVKNENSTLDRCFGIHPTDCEVI